MKKLIYISIMAIAPLAIGSIQVVSGSHSLDPADSDIVYPSSKLTASSAPAGSLLNLQRYGLLRGQNLAANLYYSNLKNKTTNLLIALEQAKQAELRKQADAESKENLEKYKALGKQRELAQLAAEKKRIENEKNLEYEKLMKEIDVALFGVGVENPEKPDFDKFNLDDVTID